MDEASLIQRCRRGNRAAQHELYAHHADRIYRLTLRLTGNHHDAFDLTQETFVRAFQRIADFDGRSQIGTWLYRIATNETLQLFRKRGNERLHLRIFAEEFDRAAQDTPASDSPDVDRALAQLSEQHRTILILKYQEQMSYDEIAKVLKIAPGTVASRMNRARSELRSILDGKSPSRAEETPDRQHPTDGALGPQDGTRSPPNECKQ